MNKLHLIYPACFMAALSSCTQQAPRPNVLLILSDDSGYADFGFNGSTDILTPHLDSLASHSTTFTDSHVMGSGSSPSRAMLLTGRYGHRFGYECNPDRPEEGLPANEETIAQILKKAGYRTSCFGKWHLGASDYQQPNRKGFDEFWGFLGGSRSFYYHPEFVDNIFLHYQHNGTPQKFDGYLTDELTDRAIDFISDGDKKTPFFMYLSYNDTHNPIEPPQKYIDAVKGDMSPKRRLYAAKITAVDTGVSRVMNALKESGQMDNTVIIFLSDNGGAATNFSSNLPLKGFKGTKFEGGHRVPMFMKIPGIDRKQFDGLTSSMDILATLVDLLDIQPEMLPNELDGVSLLPYLEGKKDGNPHDELFWRKNRSRSMRCKDWKLILMKDVDTVLYNLKNDPIECKDIKKDSTEMYGYMLGKLAEWEKDCTIPPLWIEPDFIERVESNQKKLLRNEIFSASDLKKKH